MWEIPLGLGDWVLATGQVRTLYEANQRQVVVVNHVGRPQWSPVFENNPLIAAKPTRDCQRLLNAGGARPYIAGKTPEKWFWKAWNIRPGELYLSDEERAFAEPYAGRVVIEPNTKVPNGNKSWQWNKWRELVNRGGQYIQTGAAGSLQLPSVDFVETTFRQAAAILAVSKAFVGTEGALHHAAAALDVPAVVLYSEFISPDFTGYPTQKNIRHAKGWCGSRLPCEGCRASMEAITVDEVHSALEAI